MAFNGQLSTTVYVVPRTGSGANLKFDAFLSQPGPDVTANYMLLDDRAYWSIEKDAVITSAGCLDADQLPPVQLMQASLTDAVVVSSVDDQKIECPSGKLLQLQFAGEKFVFCNSNTNQLTKAVGADGDMTIEHLADPTMLPDFTIPRVPGQSALSCPVITNDAFPNLLRSPSTTLSTRAASLGPTTCRCKGRCKPCLFVHGVGNNESSLSTRTFPKTWGSIQDHAPCCLSVALAHYESRERGWTRPRHVSGSSTSSIDNLILVTYSMGNLVAGGAVANRTCTFGSGVTWVSLVGPMQGSNASNVLEQKCASGDWSPSLAVVGYCPATEAYLQLKDQTSVSIDLYNAFQAAQSVHHRASKVLCGINASGLGSADAPAPVYVGSQAF
ncbi:hypothetical protein SPRG_16705 [Saprolegnia parasitica CBS 223.65]|uniref:Uncharacterized protein n=1 Tax=Saprolegnia parasitica (strain CBS 223.65) TaxID=695850 RepID=A0A067BI05_SAPPC|nr:hypothetical protein SPRG_16705 [Saprolegnia parasitica CBS 223.65]KDO17778.1 hypothetical protein SPRG_16705 [Saprolegnia parasitica CBS 223.65]|eukprot:XP_012211515.1 hypothetical protein SPRG_16705 [Saprolegnia parasitica CBS 223.65]